MITNNINSIVRNVLLRKRLGMHHYLDALLAALYCLKEITLDDGLDVVNIKVLPVSDSGAIEIPEGAADIVNVQVGVGQRVRSLTPNSRINSIASVGSDFSVTPYVEGYPAHSAGPFPNYGSIGGGGGIYGGYFGFASDIHDGYKVIPHRNEIQLDEGSHAGSAVVSYIGDGRSADAATHIDVNAEATIEACINWQFAESSRSYSAGERERLRQMYLQQRGILRARKAGWSIEGLKRLIQRRSRSMI